MTYHISSNDRTDIQKYIKLLFRNRYIKNLMPLKTNLHYIHTNAKVHSKHEMQETSKRQYNTMQNDARQYNTMQNDARQSNFTCCLRKQFVF